MINLIVNGEEMEVEEKSSISQLLSKVGAVAAMIAVEKNLDIIPKSDYDSTILEEGDRIEIVAFVGGG
ncbi:MAG: sulfur carrier protein ThiS [Planctomycetes bacterium]|nr:sulfur carrier protein ThiS [Planctomycetota bacterium]